MAFAAVAALFEAGAAVSAATAFAAVGTIGATLSVVGMVTGSKDLMKLGGVLGLVGGVGSIATSLTSSAATGLAETAVDATGGLETAVGGSVPGQIASDAATQAGMAGAESSWNFNVGETASVLPADSLPVNSLGMDAVPAATGDATVFPPDMTTPQVNTAGTPVNGAQSVTSPSGPLGAQTPGAVNSPADTSLSVQGNSTNALDRMTNVSYGSQPIDTTSYFDKITKWVKENEKFANNIMQVGSSMMGGIAKQSMWDQQMELMKQRDRTANSVASYAKPLGIAGAAQRGA